MPSTHSARPARPVRGALGVAVGVLLVAAACSSPAASPSTAPSTSPSTAPSTSPSTAPSSSPSGSASGTLDVTAVDYSYSLPTSVASGQTTINLTNNGKEEHQAQLARIADGKTLNDVLTALQGPNQGAALAMVTLSGGPTGVQPGSTGSVSVDLQPGNYIFLCFVSGADNVPHFAKGMVAPLQVTSETGTGTAPTTDANLGLKDFSFDSPATLTTGKHTLKVTNSGPQSHEATIVKLSDGVTVDDLRAAFASTTPPSGPPPFADVGGLSAIAPNTSATLDIDLPAGNYAFICFVPDPATGKAHAELGMIGGLTIN